MFIGLDVAHSGFTQDREGENLKDSAEYSPPGSFLILKPLGAKFIHIHLSPSTTASFTCGQTPLRKASFLKSRIAFSVCECVVGKHRNDQILTKSVSFTMAGHRPGTVDLLLPLAQTLIRSRRAHESGGNKSRNQCRRPPYQLGTISEADAKLSIPFFCYYTWSLMGVGWARSQFRGGQRIQC